MTEISEQSHTFRTDGLGDRDQQLPRRTDFLRRLQKGNLPMAVGERALLVAVGRLQNGAPGEYALHGAVVQRIDENGEAAYYSASLRKGQNNASGDLNIEYGPQVVPVTDEEGVTVFHSPDQPA